MSSFLLEVKGLGRKYGTGYILREVSFALRPGTVSLLTGRNGSGKTTLLNCLSGFDRRYKGVVSLKGGRIDHLGPDARARRGLVRTFQEPQLFGDMSVGRQVALGALASYSACRSYLKWGWADNLGVIVHGEFADRKGTKLSFGEMKLVNIERALATGASVLLLDEPLASLHAGRLGEVVASIEKARSSGRAVLIIEHQVEGVLHLVDHRYELREGELVEIS